MEHLNHYTNHKHYAGSYLNRPTFKAISSCRGEIVTLVVSSWEQGAGPPSLAWHTAGPQERAADHCARPCTQAQGRTTSEGRQRKSPQVPERPQLELLM